LVYIFNHVRANKPNNIDPYVKIFNNIFEKKYDLTYIYHLMWGKFLSF